jgi:endonuclease/exonuclease/phosphatase family metal-dependent hydrolase
LRNLLRYRVRGQHLRKLSLLIAVFATSACAGGYQLRPRATSASLSPQPIAWHEPALVGDRTQIGRWRDAVGSPLIVPATTTRPAGDRLTLVSWNIALDSGDIVAAVRDVQAAAPGTPIVLLLQEAFRSGDDIPASPQAASFAAFLGSSNRAREIDDVARALGYSLYYVPSMRNGAPGRHREDRGNAILSSLPLEDLTAIELPFERQRRVALSAQIRGVTSRGEPWRLRLATVHLDNMAGLSRGWIGGEYARTRQARGLREALRGDDPMVLAGDFNTWFGFRDQAYLETVRDYPQTRLTDTRRTFRGLLRLDHVFYRLPEGWSAEVRRAESSYGSDHHPLIATIRF